MLIQSHSQQQLRRRLQLQKLERADLELDPSCPDAVRACSDAPRGVVEASRDVGERRPSGSAVNRGDVIQSQALHAFV